MANAAKSPIQPFTINGRLGGVRLCQFFNNSADLLHGHKNWIDTYFVPKMKANPNAWVDIYGHTSRLGSDAANATLSQKRLDKVEAYIKLKHSGINVNIRGPKGEEDAASFNIEQKDNDGYWRAVLIRWFGVPLDIPTPDYPEEKPPFHLPPAPKGCWLITGVDTFGLPVHGPVSAGKIDLTLRNDQGEEWIIHAYGGGVGAEIRVDGKEAALGAEKVAVSAASTVKEVYAAAKEFGKEHIIDILRTAAMKFGDSQNVSDTIKAAKITGPSGTTGGVLLGTKWAANLTIGQIVAARSFTIGNAELQMIAGGGEIGLIVFGGLADGPSRPWGYYQSLGLGTLKLGGGVGGTLYRITSWKKLPPQTWDTN
ncbi:OmpA family protein [Sphingomonas bacterium]|uniref:OmpA family protein n=1 Tax=Sphingomonas bacterium TaxID=1895847 RepID=UPI001576CCA7|nr:hypothetical protein [Sphingomonas bacterium]